MFILRDLVKRRIKPGVITKGSQVIQLTAGPNVRIRDSYLFTLAALRKFPDMFGLKDGVGKTYFPYYFVRQDNLDYKG